jgi:hypothetical protein
MTEQYLPMIFILFSMDIHDLQNKIEISLDIILDGDRKGHLKFIDAT